VTRQIALLANPAAGRGHAHRLVDHVIEALGSDGASVTLVAGDDWDASAKLARGAVESGIDTLVAMGGDGMVHLAVQELAGSATALGIVPIGTGNDAARALGVPTSDPIAAATRIATGERRAVDLGRSGDRWFLTIMAAGFDALVNERANGLRWPSGDLRYTAATMLVLPRFSPLRYTLSLDGEDQELEAMLVAVGNTEFYGGGLQMCAGAVPDDGLLDVTIVTPVSRLELIRMFGKIRTGEHVGHPAFRQLRARSVTIAAAGVTAYADGERLGALPLTVECAPGALQVIG
jgi:diacylglycerol kinase (ATP)